LTLNLTERTCFLFDLDGTLVDSNSAHERAYLTALEALLPELAARFRYEECKGRPTREALRMYGVGEPLLTMAVEAKQQAYRAQVEAGAIVLLPHARELLTALRARGRRVFLVTGASARSTRTLLAQLGIHEWFEQIVTADDVVHGKPAPDCWLTCLERAAIAPGEALAIEDALNGVEAARGAGIACVAVNNPELAHLPEYAGSLETLLNALHA
jgi:HAD superfamily hydrolase (TIGR01509 family)